MGKLLPFPSKQSKNVTVLQKREARRLALSLSVLSIAVLAISLNERIHSDLRPHYTVAGASYKMDQLNRAIASAEPLSLVEDIQAEQDWAKKISEFERRPSSIGVAPTQADQLRYGQLQGKYRVAGQSERVSEIEYVDSSDVSDRPIMVRDAKNFLMENKDLFSVTFAKAEIDSKSAKDETFKLFAATGQVVGRAAFQYDDAGHLLSLKVRDSQ